MISFPFRVTKAFLESPDHPITIPMEHHYKLRDEGVVGKTDKVGATVAITVVLPDGRRFNGRIVHGEAGGKFYYQMRVPGEASVPLCRAFATEEFVQVVIGVVSHDVHVYLLGDRGQAYLRKFLEFKGPQAEARVLEEVGKLTRRPEALV